MLMVQPTGERPTPAEYIDENYDPRLSSPRRILIKFGQLLEDEDWFDNERWLEAVEIAERGREYNPAALDWLIDESDMFDEHPVTIRVEELRSAIVRDQEVRTKVKRAGYFYIYLEQGGV